ncbi:MAG: HpcH/HpaI aldolase family protein [Betaproteobacteria bacterium]
MRFPERLRSGPPLVATFSMIASPIVVELLAKAGYDAVVLDTEHGPLGPEALNVLVPAATGAGIAPIVRVRTNEPSLIGGALDVGAAAVLVPQVESGAQAEAAVASARFGPGGRRGSNPYVRAAGYAATAEWFGRANGDAAVLVMVEGTAGIEALDEIVATPGLDGIFIGPFDLSQSLGVPGQVEHPDVLARMERIVRSAGERRVATAAFAPTPALARRWLALGAQLVAVSFDTALALDGFRATRDAVR